MDVTVPTGRCRGQYSYDERIYRVTLEQNLVHAAGVVCGTSKTVGRTHTTLRPVCDTCMDTLTESRSPDVFAITSDVMKDYPSSKYVLDNTPSAREKQAPSDDATLVWACLLIHSRKPCDIPLPRALTDRARAAPTATPRS